MLARQKALEEELARKAAAEISSQTSALQTADEISRTGMNEAATIGVLWCAHGANAQTENRELAEQSYGNCKQYLGAADSIRDQRGRNEAFASDPASLTGDWAQQTLESFEKNFSVPRTEFVDRLANSSNRGAELAQMTLGKLNTEELAEAYSNGKAPEDEKFAVSFGSKAPKKENLRATLKKAMAAAGPVRKPASSKPASPALKAMPKGAANDNIGLTPLEMPFAPSETAELTIFQVVHRKYEELAKRF